MGRKGKPLPEEVKRKISEALKKRGGKLSKAKTSTLKKFGKEGQELLNKFDLQLNLMNSNKAVNAALKSEAKSLRASMEGKSKEEKKEIRSKIRAIRQRQKSLRTDRKIIRGQMRKIRERARQMKRVLKAKQRIKKSKLRVLKAKSLTKKANDLMQKLERKLKDGSISEKKRARIADRMARAKKRINKIRERVQRELEKQSKAEQVIKRRGKIVKKKKNIFGLTEIHCFAEKKTFKPFRALTEIEKKVDLVKLNEVFNDIESALESALIIAVAEGIRRSLKKIEGRLKAGDLASIADINVVNDKPIQKIIKEHNKEALEKGKESASSEIGVGVPSTPTINTQVSNFEAQQLAREFQNTVNAKAQEAAKEGFGKKIEQAAVLAAIAIAAREISSKMITNIKGTTVGENINRGRRVVFEKNITDLKGFMRSEILDDRTCNMCMSLDGRIVKADSPFAKLDLVHTNCRGVWVPILSDEPVDKPFGLPKTIESSFDTIAGVPTKNSFTQLKKPINKANQDVQEQIKKRLA